VPNKFKPAKRLSLPGYPFAELERKAAAVRNAGLPLYDLSIGDPDLPPPEFVIDATTQALRDDQSHKYPSSRGDLKVRQSVAKWFKSRFRVDLDPENQVCILIGAKEGLGQLARAVVNPGDIVISPEPGYPVYWRAGCKLVEGNLKSLVLEPENSYLPDIKDLSGAKLVYLNYPNNPTGAVATDNFLQSLADLAKAEPEMTIAYDMAYSEVTFGQPARSILEFTQSAVEFHSLSKMANATGYRVGFAVGDPARIQAMIRMKEETDSGVSLVFQRALAATLDSYKNGTPPPEISSFMDIYRNRKKQLISVLEDRKIEVFDSEATFYVWFRPGGSETEFVEKAIASGVLLTPGTGFGSSCGGWVRASVTCPDEPFEKALDILKSIKL
jgi:LL-diaminopimelate aminotransferase